MRVLLALLLVGIAGCGGQETLTLKGHSDAVASVSFSPDGKRIVSGSWDDTLKVWDISSLDTSR
jgi:WD40 repeat protein